MNQVAVITGASGGIGKATVKLFRSSGWHVVGIDIKKTNTCNRFLSADLSDVKQTKHVFKNIKENEKHINVLVNNAATLLCKNILETTIEDWNSVIATNLSSVFYAMKYAHPLLKKIEGAIVNVSSVHAIATSCNIAAYATSKGGLVALTRASALEFAENNIRVNAVLPGAVDTEMLLSGLERDFLSTDGKNNALNNLSLRHPLKRIGQPREIAELIFFLANNKKSSFITGQNFIADGGVLAKLSSE